MRGETKGGSGKRGRKWRPVQIPQEGEKRSSRRWRNDYWIVGNVPFAIQVLVSFILFSTSWYLGIPLLGQPDPPPTHTQKKSESLSIAKRNESYPGALRIYRQSLSDVLSDA